MIGKAVAIVVSGEVEERDVGETEPGFSRVECPVVVFAHAKIIFPSFDEIAVADEGIITIKQEVALSVVIDIGRRAVFSIFR